MRVMKLLSVSVTLWAVVVGADSATAGGPIVTPSIRIVPPSIKPPSIKPVTPSIKPPTIKPVVGTSYIRGSSTVLQPSVKFRQTTTTNWNSGITNSIPHAGPTAVPSLHYNREAGGRVWTSDSASGVYSPDNGRAPPARNYAPPTSYNSKTACGRYPYPACQ